jgi:glycosyltransferase involved in cell wall biosynthesis
MPTVSIIVPNYNHARFLQSRIDSVLRQTFQDFELILLDDCSTDESRSILSRYVSDSRVRIKFNEANSGSTFKQWNTGVRLASGKYIWIAESDDYADERLLERLVAVLDREPTVTFAYCRSWRVSEDDQLNGFADFYLDYLDSHRWQADFCVDGREECRDYLVSSNTIPNASAVVFRRAVYERVGGADESLRMCGDWKLWVAMALEGKMAYLGEPLNYFRSHETSVRSKSRKEALDVAEDLQVIRWILDQVMPTDLVLKRVCQRQAGFWVPAVMNMRVPSPLKLTILKNARAIDPHLIRRAVRPALWNIRQKLSRRWHRLRSVPTAAKT